MENLVGKDNADECIQEELIIAHIPLVFGEKNLGEVPYTITGKLGSWTFRRAWYYWMANADNDGLPLQAAIELHNKPYLIKGKNQPSTYGEVIRVAGHCGCPPPEEWAVHYDAKGRKVIIDPNSLYEEIYKDYIKRGIMSPFEFIPHFVKSLEDVVVRSVVDSYHVDTQLGLCELATVIRITPQN